MKKQKITSIFVTTLAGVLLISPLSYVKAEDKSTTGLVSNTKVTDVSSDSKEENVVTRWVDEKYKDDKTKDLKPNEEGKKAAERGKDIKWWYKFLKTESEDPKEVLHIYERKEITYKWITEKDGKEDVKLSEKKSKEELKEVDFKSEDKDKFKDLEFDKRKESEEDATIMFIYKKKGENSSSVSSKTEDKKDGDSPKTTETPKTENSTKSDDKSKVDGENGVVATNSTTEVGATTTTVAANLTTKVTTATNSNGEKKSIVTEPSTTTSTTTKAGQEATPPQYTSIFVNVNNGFEIIGRLDGVKTSIAIEGYNFVRTEVSENGREYRHYYVPAGADKESKKMTVWQDVYSGEYIISAKHGDHQAGKIEGYTYVDSKSLGDVTIHYFKKSAKVDYYYNWAYHVDIDTGELIYWNNYNSDWYYYSRSIDGYAYVNTDSWREGNVVYHTHYYKRIAKVNTQIDPAKVFTVWVDEYYNQIVPSRMGSHETGELEGYEFDRTVSVNNGYGIAHVFKKKDGDRLAGKNKDKSIGYRVRSMLPGTNATGENSILPLGIIGATGIAVAGGVYYFMRRKNNKDQNNNNFPPYSG